MEQQLPFTFKEDFHDKESVKRMPYVLLGNTGLLVSKIGYGCSHISGGATFNESGTEVLSGYEEAVKTIHQALKSGINYLDTAPLYGVGKSEVVLGKALEGIPRETYYIATKTGRKHNCDFDYSAESIRNSINESLKRLKLDYLDIAHIHDVEFTDTEQLYRETLPELDKLRKEGKIRFIAINGLILERIKTVLEKSPVKIDIVQTYCKNTLFDNSLVDYLPYFKSKGVGLINAACYGMGLLTNAGPPAWHPAKPETKTACAEAATYCRDRNVNIARLALGHSLNTEGVDVHLVGIPNFKILKENLEFLLNGLSAEEKQVLSEVHEKFFKNLKVRNWEGHEISIFKKNPKDLEDWCRREFK